MKLAVSEIGADGERTFRDVEGREARALIKSAVDKISKDIWIPEPPHTGKVRERCFISLKMGERIWTETGDDGQPGGTILVLKREILGIINTDGTYEAVGNGPKENPFAGTKEEAPVLDPEQAVRKPD